MTNKNAPENGKKQGIKRLQIGTNVVAQIVIFALIILMVNYLAFRFYERWDYSQDQSFTLSEQTKRVIEQVRGEVKFILFFSAASPVYDKLDRLIKEYQYVGKGKISVELIDPYKDFTRARELQSAYKFSAEENIVIVDYEGRTKTVTEQDIAEYDHSMAQYGELPELLAFKGEQALTSTIMEVTQDQQSVLYYVRGLGGPDIGEESPISTLIDYIKRQFIAVVPLDIASVDKVPDDADAVMLAGAKYDLSEREAGVLKEYWKNAGRIIVLLEPDSATPRLHGLLKEAGIEPRDDRILRTVDMQNVVGIIRDVSGKFQPDSRTTKGLEGVETVLLGETQSLRENLPEDSSRYEIKSPLIASEGFWGETDYGRSQGEPIIFLPSKDHGPPLSIAMTSEIGGVEDERVQVNSSRMLVVGNSGFIDNQTITHPNLDFILNTLNWMVDRDKLIGIAPKEVRQFSLNLPDSQLNQIKYLIVAIAAAAALAGVLIWLKRRS